MVENGYVASQSFNSDLAKAKAQEALGWNVGFAYDKDSVKVTFADAKGAMIDTLDLTGKLQRTVTDKEDQVLTFAWWARASIPPPPACAPACGRSRSTARATALPTITRSSASW